MKVPDVKLFLAPQGASRAPKAKSPRGVWVHASPGKFENRTLRNAVSSVSQFPRQGWSSLKFSLKRREKRENGNNII